MRVGSTDASPGRSLGKSPVAIRAATGRRGTHCERAPRKRRAVVVMRAMRRFLASGSMWLATGVDQILGERLEETLVLSRGAVADADVAGAAERSAGADDHAAPPEPVDDLRLVAFTEVDPGEVRLRVGGRSGRSRAAPPRPRSARRSSARPGRSRRRSEAAPRLPATWASRLTLNGWRTASTARPEAGGAERVAAAQPGEAVDLAEGAEQHQVRGSGEADRRWRRDGRGPASRRRPRRGSP